MFFLWVNCQMLLQVAWPTKPLWTMIAVLRILSAMNFDMLLQLVTKSKRILTKRTLLWFLPEWPRSMCFFHALGAGNGFSHWEQPESFLLWWRILTWLSKLGFELKVLSQENICGVPPQCELSCAPLSLFSDQMASYNGHICKVSYLCKELYVFAAHFFEKTKLNIRFLASVNFKMIFQIAL